MKRFALYTFAYISVIFLFNLIYQGEFGNFHYLFLTLLGLVYNLLIIFTTNILPKDIRFLSAGFVGVLICFMIFNGGIIPLMYIKDFDFIDANAFGQYLNYNMLVNFTNVVALGNIFYWIGYSSKAADYLFSFYYIGMGYKKLLNLNINALFPKMIIVVGLSLSLVLFVNGAYGRGTALPEDFSGPMRYLVTFAPYITRISMVGYFILALLYFKTGEHKIWFWVTLFIQVLFALVSGARGPIIILFILTILPYYYINKKITRSIILAGAGTLLVAFTVASEIKEFTKSMNSNSVGVTDYADAYLEFREQSSAELNRRIYESVYYSIMRRLNTVAQGSAAVRYKDQHGVDDSDPKFQQEIMTVPIYIFIPRGLTGSSFPGWGQWFRLKVLQQNNDTYVNNITFGMPGFFYLTGKWWFIIIGFTGYGIIMRFCNNILEVRSDISFLVYLAVLSAIAYVGASVPSALVGCARYIIFLPILFYIIISTLNKIRL